MKNPCTTLLFLVFSLLGINSVYSESQADRRMEKPFALAVGIAYPFQAQVAQLDYAAFSHLSFTTGASTTRIRSKAELDSVYTFPLPATYSADVTDRRAWIGLRVFPFETIPFYAAIVYGRHSGGEVEIGPTFTGSFDLEDYKFATIEIEPNQTYMAALGYRHQFVSGIFVSLEGIVTHDYVVAKGKFDYAYYGENLGRNLFYRELNSRLLTSPLYPRNGYYDSPIYVNLSLGFSL